MPAKIKSMLLRGSLISFKRKCGNPTCRCAKGKPHESQALSCTIAGKSYTITFSKVELPIVKAALARFKKRHSSLERACKEGIELLQSLIRARKDGA